MPDKVRLAALSSTAAIFGPTARGSPVENPHRAGKPFRDLRLFLDDLPAVCHHAEAAEWLDLRLRIEWRLHHHSLQEVGALAVV